MSGEHLNESVAGMTALGVLYGYGSEEEMRDAGAHHVCATPREFLDHAA
jgi:phosphoglycolate phosphatase